MGACEGMKVCVRMRMGVPLARARPPLSVRVDQPKPGEEIPH